MRKNHPRFLSPILFSLIVLIICGLTLTMCKDKSDTTNTASVKGGGGAGTFSMRSLILDSGTLKTWVDSGWTKPNKFRIMIMQFMSPNMAARDTNFMCQTFPGKKLESAGEKGRFYMYQDPSSPVVTISDTAIFANNCFDFKKDTLFLPNGDLNGFKYLRFIPKKVNNYVVFEVYKHMNKDTQFKLTSGTNPCPPCQYCPDGCPEAAEF